MRNGFCSCVHAVLFLAVPTAVSYSTIAVTFCIFGSFSQYTCLFLLFPKALTALGMCHIFDEREELGGVVLHECLVTAGITEHAVMITAHS